MAEKKKDAPKPRDRQVKSGGVRVRCGKKPMVEEGGHRFPKGHPENRNERPKNPDGSLGPAPADEWVTTAKQAKALGDRVEVLK